jgi:hypothetical protein
MNNKRLVLDLDEAEHKNLAQTARALELTVPNYVRQAVGLPIQEQGVKAPTPKKKVAGKKQAAHKKKLSAAKK